jgi:hypothetical protein
MDPISIRETSRVNSSTQQQPVQALRERQWHIDSLESPNQSSSSHSKSCFAYVCDCFASLFRWLFCLSKEKEQEQTTTRKTEEKKSVVPPKGEQLVNPDDVGEPTTQPLDESLVVSIPITPVAKAPVKKEPLKALDPDREYTEFMENNAKKKDGVTALDNLRKAKEIFRDKYADYPKVQDHILNQLLSYGYNNQNSIVYEIIRLYLSPEGIGKERAQAFIDKFGGPFPDSEKEVETYYDRLKQIFTEGFTPAPQGQVKEPDPTGTAMQFFQEHLQFTDPQGLKAAKSHFKEYQAYPKVQNAILKAILIFGRENSEFYKVLGEYLSSDVLGAERTAAFETRFSRVFGGIFFPEHAGLYEKEIVEIFTEGF